MAYVNGFLDELKNISDGIRVLTDEPMDGHTTFKVGGPADYFVVPDSVQSVVDVIRLCKKTGTPCFVIGRGSNLLVTDKGYRGVIVCIYDTLDDVKTEFAGKSDDSDDEYAIITAGAGIMLSKLAKTAAQSELTGLEFAGGIPGTLGGAVAMNAGAYGGEIKDCIQSAVVVDDEQNVITLTKEQLELGYRESIVKQKGYIVLSATFKLKKGDAAQIIATMNDFNARRRDKQPLEHPSAGSTFKRPQGMFAGKLIQDSGLAGYRVGGACVSDKHCGFVVNDNGGSAADIMQVIKDVQRTVKDKFDVELEPEVRIIGEQ